jgi:hypothetical protein
LASWVLDPDLDKYRRMDPRAIAATAMDTIAGGVPDDIRADYLACYDGDRFAESMRYVRTYPEELPALDELLPQIATPVTSSRTATGTSCGRSPPGCPGGSTPARLRAPRSATWRARFGGRRRPTASTRGAPGSARWCRSTTRGPGWLHIDSGQIAGH